MTYPLVKFGDVVHQVKDVVDPREAGLERYIAGEHMDTGNLHLSRWGIIGNNYLGPAFHMRFTPGQVLYGSRRTYLRKVALADFEGICANTIMYLSQTDPQVLSPDLLPFIMQTDLFNEHSVKQSKGSVNPYINFSDLALYEFPLPPLDEQRRIAELLVAADNAVSENKTLIHSLEQLKKSYRDNFFGNPNDWCKVQLGKIFEIKLGKMVSPKSRQGPSPKKYMSNINIQWGRIDLSEIREMDFDEDEFDRYRLQNGDLLVCEGGEVGRSAIWRDEFQECGYQKALHRLRPLSNELEPEVLLQFMFYAASKGFFAKFTGQSTIANLPAEKLRLVEVVIPPYKEQISFLESFSNVENALSSVFAHQKETQSFQKTLLNGWAERA